MAEQNLEVGVFNADGVDKLFFVSFGLEHDMIGELVETAHVGCFRFDKVDAGGVFLENIVKDGGIVEVFGDGNF